MYTKIFFNPNLNPEILTLTIKIGNILRKKKFHHEREKNVSNWGLNYENGAHGLIV